MRVVIADDEELARFTLRSMLGELPYRFSLIGEAQDGEELRERVQQLAPELVFVDIRMPRLNGLDAIDELLDEWPSTVWVVVSAHDEFPLAQRAIRLGVFRYLLKPVDPAELHETVDDAVREISKARPPEKSEVSRAHARAISERVLGGDPVRFSESVRRLIEWTENNFRDFVGLSQAAEAIDLSVGYLSSRFAEETGTNFTTYLTALRMETAHLILAGPRTSMDETAASVGYASRRHFARRFREYWGMSPAEARDPSRAT